MACPASCPFNPFSPANLEQGTQIESKLLSWAGDRLATHAETDALLARISEETDMNESPQELLDALLAREFFWRNERGATFAEEWEASGLEGLRNDERVLFRGQRQMRLALFEAHRFPEPDFVEGVDRFTGERLLIADTYLPRTSVRFTRVLAWVYPLPHHWRIFGEPSVWLALDRFPAVEALSRILTHLGVPEIGPERQTWLALNMARVREAWDAADDVSAAILGRNADYRRFETTFRLADSADDVADSLAEDPRTVSDSDDDDEGEVDADGETEGHFSDRYGWVLPASPEAPWENKALAQIVLTPSTLSVGSPDRASLETAIAEIRELLGDRIVGDGTIRTKADLVASLDEPDLIPPELPGLFEAHHDQPPLARISRLPVAIERSAAFHQADWRRFLTSPLPALDHRSPSEAAAIPELKPRVAGLIQCRIEMADIRCATEKTPVHPLPEALATLGLPELLLPPPPHLPQARVWSAGAPDAPMAPPLPAEPMGAEEADRRLQAAMEKLPEGPGAFEEPEYGDSETAPSSPIFPLVNDVLSEEISWAERIKARLLVQILWKALVPGDCRAPEPDVLRTYGAFQQNLDRLYTLEEFGEATAATDPTLHPQPKLSEQFAALVVGFANPNPEEEPLFDNFCIVIIAFGNALIAEMDRLLRRPAA